MSEGTNATREPCGVLIVNKHAGATSHDIVNKIRRLYGTKKVGHAGTLDPMATGVLVVLIGRAAKAAEYLQKDKKCYLAGLRLGLTTDTEDVTGATLTTSDTIPTPDEVGKAAACFKGRIMQIPPMYSALKVGGRKLYELAREGKTVEREPRPVDIFDIECRATEQREEYTLRVACSGGTYIRTLCADIGARLGCGGVMSSLCRTEACGYDISGAKSIAELEEMDGAERISLLLPIEGLFSDLPAIKLHPFFEKLCRSGCGIFQKKIGVSIPLGERVRICDERGRFFALGESMTDAETGESTIKAIKTFEL